MTCAASASLYNVYKVCYNEKIFFSFCAYVFLTGVPKISRKEEKKKKNKPACFQLYFSPPDPPPSSPRSLFSPRIFLFSYRHLLR